ncbi:hypothetical protein CTAYLR_000519 [Chrysophaeum taylorii]|uniref:T6SS Phospholipase effector Tle1-like catalytic domain-containing protein n=1 Tax=Chrysophaeum taylorii TaxID=2483200 RepID=A0AAD7UHR4_9STRA|nr:hypothetical protein CTAYLR_000519 [Chrysophaeum taylorii]
MVSRNIVMILCDGSGNGLRSHLPNVAKIYMSLDRDDQQLVFYDAGYRSLWSYSSWCVMCRIGAQSVFQLATGHGLRRKVCAFYEFLVENWRDDDKIFMIGFSRGACTVRMVASMIRTVGLLRREQRNLVDSAFNAYVGSTEDADDCASDFRRRARSRCAAIEYVGLFDSVSSVLVPSQRGCIPRLERLRTLPHTLQNCVVRAWRDAIAVYERLIMFTVDRVQSSAEGYRPIPWVVSTHASQDIKEVWFAGYHTSAAGTPKPSRT